MILFSFTKLVSRLGSREVALKAIEDHKFLPVGERYYVIAKDLVPPTEVSRYSRIRTGRNLMEVLSVVNSMFSSSSIRGNSLIINIQNGIPSNKAVFNSTVEELEIAAWAALQLIAELKEIPTKINYYEGMLE